MGGKLKNADVDMTWLPSSWLQGKGTQAKWCKACLIFHPHYYKCRKSESVKETL